ncbi:MAG: DUF1080 domain-containing protein, partial [Cyclobacteriaceae bacterium]|nr:DUF1080 domain-containing protein [Cyclobacteriaceae bacterium]
MKHFIYILFIYAAVSSCKTKTENTETTIDSTAVSSTEAPTESEWISLINGNSTEGWRAYNGTDLPPGWVAKDGELSFNTELGLEQDYQGGTDIIYGKEEFENFELSLEWKIPEGGNSGIFYHLTEGHDSPTGFSPEYQLIDDEGYTKIHDVTAYNESLGNPNPSELQPSQKSGSDYAMYAANPEEKVLNPVGEWNTTRIVFTPEKVEYYLNGKLTVSFVPWSDDWNERKNNGKWKNYPDYGMSKTGYIGLQDHKSPIWFRNIK